MSDWTDEEYKKLLGFKLKDKADIPQASSDEYLNAPNRAGPNQMYADACGTNQCTGVKNQGSCGSCYAFAATAVIETMLAKYTGQPAKDLSEQQFVDCSSDYGNYGCGGGNYF